MAGLNATSRFTLTVNPVNDGPTISSVGSQFVQESGNSGPIPFTIGDLETTASALVVTAVSLNQAVIQNSGPGAGRERGQPHADDYTGAIPERECNGVANCA